MGCKPLRAAVLKTKKLSFHFKRDINIQESVALTIMQEGNNLIHLQGAVDKLSNLSLAVFSVVAGKEFCQPQLLS